jgi:hypothetical protein
LNQRSRASEARDHSRLVHVPRVVTVQVAQAVEQRCVCHSATGGKVASSPGGTRTLTPIRAPGLQPDCLYASAVGYGRQSIPRESNPHVCQGKAAGCRYLTDASRLGHVVKDPANEKGQGSRDTWPVRVSPNRFKVTGAADRPAALKPANRLMRLQAIDYPQHWCDGTSSFPRLGQLARLLRREHSVDGRTGARFTDQRRFFQELAGWITNFQGTNIGNGISAAPRLARASTC